MGTIAQSNRPDESTTAPVQKDFVPLAFVDPTTPRKRPAEANETGAKCFGHACHHAEVLGPEPIPDGVPEERWP